MHRLDADASRQEVSGSKPPRRPPLVISVMRAEAPADRAPVSAPAIAKPMVTTAAASMHSVINWRMRLRGRALIVCTV